MKISGPGQIRAGSPRRSGKTAEAATENFADHLKPDAAGASGVSAAAPVAPVDALLTLQEVPDSQDKKKRAIARANDLLGELDEIRHGLLLGILSESRLKSLARRLNARVEQPSDPHLAQILKEIELRVSVELAKIGMESN